MATNRERILETLNDGSQAVGYIWQRTPFRTLEDLCVELDEMAKEGIIKPISGHDLIAVVETC